MQELLIEVLRDTLSMLPFLYLTYLFMEYLEHKGNPHMQRILVNAKKLGPLIGSTLGIVPQCGFSIVASGLYINKSITLGTLIAVFISTSDEAIPILIAQPEEISTLGAIIFVKLMIGIIAGYTIDFLVKEHRLTQNFPRKNIHEHCEEEVKEHRSIFMIAFYHSMKIFAFIFVVNFILSFIIHLVGVESVSTLMIEGSIFQPIIASIVGFIPNCAASILLAQLYVDGVISFGALTAGLITSAGLGLLVLFRMYDNKKDIARILFILFLIACLSGILLQLWM